MSTEKTDACCCLHVTTCPLIEMTDLSNFTPEYISKKALFQKDTCIPMFIAALFTTASIWKQTKCPSTDGWIKKMWYIHTMEYYSAIKKNEIMPFAATWMDLEIIILSQRKKEK